MTRLSTDGYIVIDSLPQPLRDQLHFLIRGQDLMTTCDPADGYCIDLQNYYLILAEAGLPFGGDLIN